MAPDPAAQVRLTVTVCAISQAIPSRIICVHNASILNRHLHNQDNKDRSTSFPSHAEISFAYLFVSVHDLTISFEMIRSRFDTQLSSTAGMKRSGQGLARGRWKPALMVLTLSVVNQDGFDLKAKQVLGLASSRAMKCAMELAKHRTKQQDEYKIHKTCRGNNMSCTCGG